jgi:hypothetical protein
MSNPSLQRALEYDFRAQGDEGLEKAQRDRPEGDDVTVTPSQAEGDRDTVEEDEGDPGDDNFGRESGGQGLVQPTPSQAEGDRQEINRDLREKDKGGKA